MGRSRIIALLVVFGGGACSVGEGGDGSPFGDLPAAQTDGKADASGDDSETDTDGGGSDGDTDAADPTDTDAEPGDDDASQYIEDARENFPTYLDLHEKVIQRTCTPFNNVCHNNREYPDLRTPQGMLDRLGQPCNIVELYDDPLTVYNGCEPPGDRITFTDGGNSGWSSEIAYVELTDDGAGNIVSARIQLADPIPAAMAVPGTLESITIGRDVGGAMLTVGSIPSVAAYTAGTDSILINDWAGLTATEQNVLEGDVVGGDPNRDGVFGAAMPDAMREIVPGSPESSYLLQRLQGEVPGSPMPLANQPLDASEIIAIACWIEGAAEPALAGVDAVIDYDNCDYAAQFAEPPEGGGATLSEHVQPIFDVYCNAGGCHGAVAPAAGLDLSAGNARDSLLEDSAQHPGVPRVTPLNPTNSYLVTKLMGDGQSGVRMPLGAAPLSEGDVEIIRTWIIQGAPDN
jgi:hypothetical protein